MSLKSYWNRQSKPRLQIFKRRTSSDGSLVFSVNEIEMISNRVKCPFCSSVRTLSKPARNAILEMMCEDCRKHFAVDIIRFRFA
jgi:transposase-like protein